MKEISQKKIFLDSEGDAWFERNYKTLKNREYSPAEPIIASIIRCQKLIQGRPPNDAGMLLEVGCGEGGRLQWIEKNLGIKCHGVEPSSKAVAATQKKEVSAVRGTAEMLPYKDETFDYLVFGFCLYLCDPSDLFQIAKEANRVLKSHGWIVIHDFFSPTPVERPYHHRAGIISYKMDFRRLFEWHPSYTCFSHEVRHHEKSEFTDEPGEWVATSVLRKRTAS
jgi:ubiquinone/menaquinone biosynthesis C-methylase UbiE